MRETLSEGNFDTKLTCSDWRYSASIVGLILYFKYNDIEFKEEEDYILYNYADIQKERYLFFAEKHFEEYMYHCRVEQLANYENLTENGTKEINELIKKNTILKKIFKDVKYPETSLQKILELLNENRLQLIEETFKNGNRLYENYSSKTSFFREKEESCRLKGYKIDSSRKGKANAYNFNKQSFVYNDCLEFDFIPFAFTKTFEAIFINNNFTIKQLYHTYLKLNEYEQPRKAIFSNMKESSVFFNYDVEVISKEMENDYFQTLFIRIEAINIFKKIENYNYFEGRKEKLPDGSYLDLEREITNSILNLNRLDSLIVFFLKKNNHYSILKILINANIKICNGGKEMEKQSIIAMYKAKEVAKKLDESKVLSFKNKLLSAIAIGDYDNFNIILIKLANYSEVDMSFAYDLFDDFEGNKNVAFSFINGLIKEKKVKEGENENE